MAAPKHLHELLKQYQEPFQLKNYINDRRSQLERTTNATNNHTKTTSSAVQGRKRKPSVEALTNCTIPKRSLCKHACFFSFNDSPDVRKSPYPDFRSPAKSPTKGGKVYLHVPPKTAALLLEAAMRIQRQQTSSSISKPKSQVKNIGFGLFSSFIKKLKDRNRNKRYEIRGSQFEIPTTSAQKMKENVAVGSSIEEGCSCSYNNSRLSSAGWSESNEEKSPDIETSTSSSRSQDSEGMDFVSHDRLINCSSPEDRFFTSPLSPFRFSLQRSPSFAGGRTPDFSSPAASPSRHKDEEKKKYDENASDERKELEAEEEKEQCSPVSVLDPAFQDEEDNDGHEEEEDDEDYDDLECSFAFVQRAKEQLLYKLRRFEKLAELDPIELEKRMMEQLDEDDDDKESLDVLEEEGEDKECLPLHRGCSSILDSFVNEVCTKSSLQSRRKVPTDMKRLVSDLISEEKRAFRFLENREIVVGRVCKKLDSWKEVESNTIDMMVEWDFRSELDEWKRFQEQRDETAMEIEIAIFGDLLDQLSDELLY